MQSAINHFRNHSGKASSTEIAEQQRQKWFIAARDQRERKQEMEQRADDDLFDLATSVIVATEIEAQQFHAKLDTYDEATVRALMENQEALDVVRSHIEELLSKAHQLEDGRRVFKTEDGLEVFDEHGNQIDEDTIHPDAIPDHLPRWEVYSQARETEADLINEREAIIIYQEDLDNAREQSSVEGFSKEDLDALDADLEVSMPLAIKRQLPDYDPENEITLKSDFAVTAPRISSIVPEVVMAKSVNFTPMD